MLSVELFEECLGTLGRILESEEDRILKQNAPFVYIAVCEYSKNRLLTGKGFGLSVIGHLNKLG